LLTDVLIESLGTRLAVQQNLIHGFARNTAVRRGGQESAVSGLVYFLLAPVLSLHRMM
jgi:hypothetical protein